MFSRAASLLTYAAVMVSGTTLLMAALGGAGESGLTGPDGQRMTASEVVMQSAAERALVSPKSAVLAGDPTTTERRGP